MSTAAESAQHREPSRLLQSTRRFLAGTNPLTSSPSSPTLSARSTFHRQNTTCSPYGSSPSISSAKTTSSRAPSPPCMYLFDAPPPRKIKPNPLLAHRKGASSTGLPSESLSSLVDLKPGKLARRLRKTPSGTTIAGSSKEGVKLSPSSVSLPPPTATSLYPNRPGPGRASIRSSSNGSNNADSHVKRKPHTTSESSKQTIPPLPNTSSASTSTSTTPSSASPCTPSPIAQRARSLGKLTRTLGEPPTALVYPSTSPSSGFGIGGLRVRRRVSLGLPHINTAALDPDTTRVSAYAGEDEDISPILFSPPSPEPFSGHDSQSRTEERQLEVVLEASPSTPAWRRHDAADHPWRSPRTPPTLRVHDVEDELHLERGKEAEQGTPMGRRYPEIVEVKRYDHIQTQRSLLPQSQVGLTQSTKERKGSGGIQKTTATTHPIIGQHIRSRSQTALALLRTPPPIPAPSYLDPEADPRSPGFVSLRPPPRRRPLPSRPSTAHTSTAPDPADSPIVVPPRPVSLHTNEPPSPMPYTSYLSPDKDESQSSAEKVGEEKVESATWSWTKRAERTQDWSGEWNREDMRDVIVKLRTLK